MEADAAAGEASHRENQRKLLLNELERARRRLAELRRGDFLDERGYQGARTTRQRQVWDLERRLAELESADAEAPES